jgi:adenylate cyclase
MLTIRINESGQAQEYRHGEGILELGRGPQREHKRLMIQDQSVSRDQLQIEELVDGGVRIRNVSRNREVRVADAGAIAIGESRELSLPVRLSVGQTQVEILSGGGNLQKTDTDDQPLDKDRYVRLPSSPGLSFPSPRRRTLKSLGEAPRAEEIARWLESIIGLQHAPAGSKEFYQQTAQALVELIDLELGIVLLRRQAKWEIVGHHAQNDRVSSRYSRTLLNQVVNERRTFYQDANTRNISESLADVSAVVVSPIFGLENEVAGVLYGSRSWGGFGVGQIRALEAQVVELLAATLSENLTRTAATRTRTQFEQFFSPELVRELERNPKLLDGQSQEVTILVSDLRGFTALSERLEAETTCRVLRDLMERLTERIIAEGGVIVDYAGDGILAMWNAPASQSDHAERACRAALAMLKELPGLNERWQATIGGSLALGVGINTGTARVGNTGSSRKLKYGPHGLTVNLASRVQDATKKVGVSLLVSQSVRDQVGDRYATRSVGRVELKGIAGPVELFELSELSAAGATSTDTTSPEVELYENP